MLSSSSPLAVVVLIVGVVLAQDCSQLLRLPPNRCCNISKLISEDFVHPCIPISAFNGVFEENIGPSSSCIMECAFKAAGIWQQDVICVDQLRTTLTNSANGNQDVINVINAALTKCVNTDGTPTAAALPSNAQCNVIPETIFGCVHWDVLLNCPASLATSSEECTAYRTSIKNCPRPVLF